MEIKQGSIVRHLLNNKYYIVVSVGYLYEHTYSFLLAELKDPTRSVLTAIAEELEVLIEDETIASQVLYKPK